MEGGTTGGRAEQLWCCFCNQFVPEVAAQSQQKPELPKILQLKCYGIKSVVSALTVSCPARGPTVNVKTSFRSTKRQVTGTLKQPVVFS